MGNTREIRQLPLTENYGVVLNIRPNKEKNVIKLLKEKENITFYTYYIPPYEEGLIYNLDSDDLSLDKSEIHRLVIQSGGKMWCGYNNFCIHIRKLARYLENSEFLIGDEINYIDQFSIRNGELIIERVHSGYWISIDTFIKQIREI